MKQALLLLGACLGALYARLGHAYTMTVYDNMLCEGPPLSATTIKQDECVVLTDHDDGERERSGFYTCILGKLKSEVWVGSKDCGRSTVTPISKEFSVGGSSATDSDPDCDRAPWLQNGERWVEIDCAAGSMLYPATSVLLLAVAGLAAALG